MHPVVDVGLRNLKQKVVGGIEQASSHYVCKSLVDTRETTNIMGKQLQNYGGCFLFVS